LVRRYVSRYLGIGGSKELHGSKEPHGSQNRGMGISDIRRMKFSSFIRPFAPLLLNIEKKGTSVSFKISSPDGATVYSQGSFTIMGEE